jgi:hypothetical protein
MRCSFSSFALVSCVLHSRLHEKMMRMLLPAAGLAAAAAAAAVPVAVAKQNQSDDNDNRFLARAIGFRISANS